MLEARRFRVDTDRLIGAGRRCRLMAECGFSRMPSVWQCSANDRSPAVRLAKRLAAVDPQLSVRPSNCLP